MTILTISVARGQYCKGGWGRKEWQCTETWLVLEQMLGTYVQVRKGWEVQSSRWKGGKVREISLEFCVGTGQFAGQLKVALERQEGARVRVYHLVFQIKELDFVLGSVDFLEGWPSSSGPSCLQILPWPLSVPCQLHFPGSRICWLSAGFWQRVMIWGRQRSRVLS